MKILFLSQIVPYPPHGGVLQRGYNVIRQMSKYFDIHLLAFVHPDVLGTDELLERSKKELSEHCSEIEYFTLWPKKSKFNKYIAFALGIFTRAPFSVLAHRSPSMKHRISQLIAAEKVDLIHFDTIGLADFQDAQMRCPTVLTHHNIESILMARRAAVEENYLKKLYVSTQAQKIKKYEALQSSQFSCNIMMSENDAATLQQIAPSATTAIIPNGVDTEYFTPCRGKETEALIYTGGMNMFANKDAILYFLTKIWPRIKARKPECIFYAVGQDPPEELLKVGREDPTIKITGYVDDIRPLVARAAVYVVPLRVGGGTRLKIVDAMAQGKAIVSTSIGCEGIAVSPGENIITADTATIFAQEVLSLLDNPARCRALGDAARQMVEEHYSWETIGKEIEELYSTIITTSQ